MAVVEGRVVAGSGEVVVGAVVGIEEVIGVAVVVGVEVGVELLPEDIRR